MRTTLMNEAIKLERNSVTGVIATCNDILRKIGNPESLYKTWSDLLNEALWQHRKLLELKKILIFLKRSSSDNSEIRRSLGRLESSIDKLGGCIIIAKIFKD